MLLRWCDVMMMMMMMMIIIMIIIIIINCVDGVLYRLSL